MDDPCQCHPPVDHHGVFLRRKSASVSLPWGVHGRSHFHKSRVAPQKRTSHLPHERILVAVYTKQRHRKYITWEVKYWEIYPLKKSIGCSYTRIEIKK